MFAQLLGDNLRVPRRPLSDPNRPVPFSPSELEGRIGSKILPAWINITDDGKRAKNGNQPLVGTYEFDMDGVPPKPVKVAEGGVLKSYLLTRQPVPGFNASTGHARLPGPFGARTAAISNLFVDATESVPATELKNQLIAMIKQRNKPYGLLVRKLDYPSSANPEDLRSLFSQASSKPLTPPTLVYRVYPDGREELVRGLRFRGVSSRTLRDIVAASKETAQFDFLNNAAVFALMAAGGFLAPTSVVSPGVLFEDMELERPQEAFQRGPIVPPPSLEK
jgi:predicted Zn-dependent protease